MAIASIEPYPLPEPHSWPRPRAPWAFAPARAALLVHDMQQYFLEPYDPGASPLRDVLHNLRLLRGVCTRAGIPVIFSMQPGEQSRSERGLLWDMWGPGIVERPEAAGFDSVLSPTADDVLLHKHRYSAFFGTSLRDILRERGRDQLMIGGVYAHIGCLATANDAFMHGVQPFVVADATADFSATDHALALRQVARTCGMVETTDTLATAIAEAHVRELVRAALECDVDALGRDDDLGDHGLDSVRAMHVVEALLPDGHDHDFAVIAEARSVRALARLCLPAAR